MMMKFAEYAPETIKGRKIAITPSGLGAKKTVAYVNEHYGTSFTSYRQMEDFLCSGIYNTRWVNVLDGMKVRFEWLDYKDSIEIVALCYER
jgi:hypothetical protein